jgi:hypothetical protein
MWITLLAAKSKAAGVIKDIQAAEESADQSADMPSPCSCSLPPPPSATALIVLDH